MVGRPGPDDDDDDDDDVTLADIESEDWPSRELELDEVDEIDFEGRAVLMQGGERIPITEMRLAPSKTEGRLVAGPLADGGWIYLDFTLHSTN